MKYPDYLYKYQKAVDKLIDREDIFFAVSKERFLEQNPNREQVYNFCHHGFIFTKGWDKFIKDAKKMNKEMKRFEKLLNPKEVILYELRYYKAFFTGELGEVFESVRSFGYSYEMVKDVYSRYKR